MIRLFRGGLAACILATVFVSGCANGGPESDLLTTGALPPPSDERPQDEPVSAGKFHYSKGSYGLAERSFRQAVEANPKSAEAWLGLAASYDRLRRFELADRAYERVFALQGRTVEALNNRAYHYMLKGDLGQARKLLDEAAGKDPGNPVIAGNFRLLETWKSGESELAAVR